MSYIPALKKLYAEQVVPELVKSRGYTNKHQVPKLVKINLNTGIDAEADKNQIADVQRDLGLIAGQKPILAKSRKAIANFKLKQGQVVGCHVTLRGPAMWEFLQRLIAVALAIRLARRSLSADDPELDRQLGAAEEGVREAAVELRAVAHGLFPAVLDEEGVAAALDELSEQTPRLVPGALPTGRFPSAVESAVYFAVVESLRLTTHDVTVDAVKEDGWLYLTIDSDDLTGAALLQIQDRAGAVGGEASLGDGRLRVEMPCE